MALRRASYSPICINYTGCTSIEVGVRVEAGDLRSGGLTHTNSAYVVLVAVDDGGRPVAVPEYVPQTDEERQRHAAARRRQEQRLAQRETA